MNVLCIGDCGVDLYLPALQRHAGGIALNVALAARRWFPGTDRIQLAAPLGKDDAADMVRSRLDGTGVTAEFSLRTGATPIQEIEIDKFGERHFRGYHEGVLRDYRARDLSPGLLDGADLLIAPVFAQNREMFLSVIHANSSALRAVDFADFAVHQDFDLLESVLARVDVGFFALAPEQELVIGRLRELACVSNSTFVITLGAHGSRAFRGELSWQCAAVPVAQVIDTTGAGDAFVAGFLSRYSHDRNMPMALRMGANAAREALTRMGGN